jgi:hypothetical protein
MKASILVFLFCFNHYVPVAYLLNEWINPSRLWQALLCLWIENPGPWVGAISPGCIGLHNSPRLTYFLESVYPNSSEFVPPLLISYKGSSASLPVPPPFHSVGPSEFYTQDLAEQGSFTHSPPVQPTQLAQMSRCKKGRWKDWVAVFVSPQRYAWILARILICFMKIIFESSL